MKYLLSIIALCAFSVSNAQSYQWFEVPYNIKVSPIEIFKYNVGSSPTTFASTKMFIGTATTNSSGVATFEITSTGTSGGSALFSTISVYVATAELNSGTISSIPLSSIKVLSSGKTLTVNVVESAGILIGGQGLELSSAGIVVNLIVIGQ